MRIKRSRNRSRLDDLRAAKAKGTTGRDIAMPQLPKLTKRSVRGILKDLVGAHSTEIAMRCQEGLLTPNLRLALKYLQFAASYVDGKPVETHRMVGLQDGPSGTYDLTKLEPKQQKELMKLLRKAKDRTEPKGEP
jgi:hypothetical protein